MLLQELAAHGTITAVAKATFRTPSAVSQQLKILEEEVGVQLMEPVGRGVRLTEAGHLLAQGALDVQTVLNRIDAVIDDFTHEVRGKVSVSAFPTAAEMLLPGTLRRLLDAPGIVVECTDRDALTTEYVSMLNDFHIVLAFADPGEEPWRHPDVMVTPLMREPVDVVVPADHPLARKAQLTARDVIGIPWVGSPQGFPFEDRRARIEAQAGRRATILQRFADNHVSAAFVAAGLGIAFLPRFTTAPRAGDGFVLRPLKGITLARDIVALTRRDHAQRAVIRRVLGALTTEAEAVVARNTPGDAVSALDVAPDGDAAVQPVSA